VSPDCPSCGAALDFDCCCNEPMEERTCEPALGDCDRCDKASWFCPQCDTFED
jgi:hypothetical protein